MDGGDLGRWLNSLRDEYKYNVFAEATNEKPAPGVLEALSVIGRLLPDHVFRA